VNLMPNERRLKLGLEFNVGELARFLAQSLRTYDVRHVTKSYMNRLEPGAQGLVNLERKKIYMRNSLQNGDHDRVFLHELAHVYRHGLLADDSTEEDVWELAYAWLDTLYGQKSELK